MESRRPDREIPHFPSGRKTCPSPRGFASSPQQGVQEKRQGSEIRLRSVALPPRVLLFPMGWHQKLAFLLSSVCGTCCRTRVLKQDSWRCECVIPTAGVTKQ